MPMIFCLMMGSLDEVGAMIRLSFRRKNGLLRLAVAVFFIISRLLAGVFMSKEAALIILQGQTMGTDYTVKYIDWADGRALPSPAAIKAQIERRLHEVNAEMSPYLPDSAISQFNQLRDDRWFLLPPDFATVLREAVALHEVTQGGLDVSLGALVNLWGFGPEPRRDSPPPPDAIAARTSGMGQFELAEESGMWFVRKHAPLLQLDLCAIAKGYGVDAVAGVLAAADIGDFLVEIGGELYGRGVNPQRQPWRVGVEHPLQRTQHVAVVALDGLALATSGDYRNFFVDDNGAMQSHVIDPRSGRPVRHDIASLSVLAPTAMRADGLATGLYALGAEAAWAVATQQDLAVCLVTRRDGDFHRILSPAFQAQLQSA